MAVIWPRGVIVAWAMILTFYCDTGPMYSGQYVRDGAVACGRQFPLGTEFIIDGRRYE